MITEQANGVINNYWWITSVLVPMLAPVAGGVATYFAIRSIESFKANKAAERSKRAFYSELNALKEQLDTHIIKIFNSLQDFCKKDGDWGTIYNYEGYNLVGLNKAYELSFDMMTSDIRRSFLSIERFDSNCRDKSEKLDEAFDQFTYVMNSGGREKTLIVRTNVKSRLRLLLHSLCLYRNVVMRMVQHEDRYKISDVQPSVILTRTTLDSIGVDIEGHEVLGVDN